MRAGTASISFALAVVLGGGTLGSTIVDESTLGGVGESSNGTIYRYRKDRDDL